MSNSTVLECRAALEASNAPWRPRTTAQLLDEVAARYPGRPLLLGDDRSYTYADIARWSRRLAAGLMAIGVVPGDHVAVDMANLPEVVALKFAVARVGAVSVSINFLLRQEELRYVLRQSDAAMLITMDHFRDLDYLAALDQIAPGWENHAGGRNFPALRHVFVHGTTEPVSRGSSLSDLITLGAAIDDEKVNAQTASVSPERVSDVLYTSGTTGEPKGVMLRHDAVLRTAYASVYHRALSDGHRMLFALPIYHVFGYVEGLIATLFTAGACCAHTSFDAKKALGDIERHRINELICVPAMTSVILDAARAGNYDLSTLHTMFSSGGAHKEHMWSDMLRTLEVRQLFTAYGQTETTASTLCVRPNDTVDRLVTTVGCPKLAGAAGEARLGGLLATYKVVDPTTGADLTPGTVGELVVTGPAVTRGYYNKPAETAAAFTPDGWFRTGDLGRLDDQGYLILTGRKKESYRCGGELVMPGEVEQVLSDHPQVAAAHVVGIPHERMGEVGCAWIVPSATSPSAEELIAYCANRLARFKVPAVVLFTNADDLPMTATGRVRKFALAERAARLLAQTKNEDDFPERAVS